MHAMPPEWHRPLDGTPHAQHVRYHKPVEPRATLTSARPPAQMRSMEQSQLFCAVVARSMEYIRRALR